VVLAVISYLGHVKPFHDADDDDDDDDDGVSPDLKSTASFRALCAGVLSGKRRMWPKME